MSIVVLVKMLRLFSFMLQVKYVLKLTLGMITAGPFKSSDDL